MIKPFSKVLHDDFLSKLPLLIIFYVIFALINIDYTKNIHIICCFLHFNIQ